ncbi:MAG: nucleotidyltransferase domain-containing protein [Cyanobacteriota bacterium]
MNISEIIKELNKLINESYGDFKGSYLYGSRAKGNAKEDSDLDVVALFDNINKEKDFELSGIVCDLMYKYDIFIDLQVYTLEKLEKNPIYYNEVVNKGIFYAP